MRANFDSLKFAVEGLSGCKNTVIFDDRDMPSIMVKIPAMKNSQLIAGGTEEVHDAFKTDTVTYEYLFIGKYLASVINDRAYSLAGKDPKVNVNFDTARTYCRNKGKGWHLTTNALYAAIALWSKKNGTQPHGNTQWGKDVTNTWETGSPTMKDTSEGAHKNQTGRTATGSGPDSWYHDYNSATGIADLCGNVWEWASGLRLKDGEIQVISYGNAMNDTLTGDQDIMGVNSAKWQTIKTNGEFAKPGDADSLKYDYKVSPIDNAQGIDLTKTISHKQSQESNFAYTAFYGTSKNASITGDVPKRAILLGLYPESSTGTDYINRGGLWMRNMGERLPVRGGDWYNGTGAGAFALGLNNLRSDSYWRIGFRPAYFGTL